MTKEITMPTYRKASLNDVERLVEIRCVFLSEASGLGGQMLIELEAVCKDYFIKAIAEGSFAAWVAESGGEIIATSGICFYNMPPNKSCPNGSVAYVQNMYTKKEFRRQGIAKKLFEKMIAEAQARGCSKILLNATNRENLYMSNSDSGT